MDALGGSDFSTAGLTVGRVGSEERDTSPDILAFSPSELIVAKVRAWSARNRWRLNGRGRSRLLVPNDAEATRKNNKRLMGKGGEGEERRNKGTWYWWTSGVAEERKNDPDTYEYGLRGWSWTGWRSLSSMIGGEELWRDKKFGLSKTSWKTTRCRTWTGRQDWLVWRAAPKHSYHRGKKKGSCMLDVQKGNR